MKDTIYSIFTDESAQGATEYILMLVVVVGIAALFKEKILKIIETKTIDLGDKLNSVNP
jgi:hypothetical protein